MTDVLLSQMRAGLMVVTMNRPESHNVLSPALCVVLAEHLGKAAEDPAVRAVVLTGAGGTFSVGGDVKAMNEGSITALATEPGGSLIVMPDATTNSHSELIIGLAARYRLPAIYQFRYFAAAGGLISYGYDPVDLFHRAASYVDRILRGEKPRDLPVQQPQKFELVINIRTAKVLGLDVPEKLLALADQVIE